MARKNGRKCPRSGINIQSVGQSGWTLVFREAPNLVSKPLMGRQTAGIGSDEMARDTDERKGGVPVERARAWLGSGTSSESTRRS